MNTRPSLDLALVAYREGRREDALRIAVEVWRTASDARAASLLAEIEMEARHLDAALAWSDRARAADPRNMRHAIQGARIAALKADHADAFERYAALLREAPRSYEAWSEFADAARASGREAEAVALCIRAFDAHPTASLILLALLSLTPDTPVAEVRPGQAFAPRVPIS